MYSIHGMPGIVPAILQIHNRSSDRKKRLFLLSPYSSPKPEISAQSRTIAVLSSGQIPHIIFYFKVNFILSIHITHCHLITTFDSALQNLFCQCIFQLCLNGTFQRSCSHIWHRIRSLQYASSQNPHMKLYIHLILTAFFKFFQQ